MALPELPTIIERNLGYIGTVDSESAIRYLNIGVIPGTYLWRSYDNIKLELIVNCGVEFNIGFNFITKFNNEFKIYMETVPSVKFKFKNFQSFLKNFDIIEVFNYIDLKMTKNVQFIPLPFCVNRFFGDFSSFDDHDSRIRDAIKEPSNLKEAYEILSDDTIKVDHNTSSSILTSRYNTLKLNGKDYPVYQRYLKTAKNIIINYRSKSKLKNNINI